MRDLTQCVVIGIRDELVGEVDPPGLSFQAHQGFHAHDTQSVGFQDGLVESPQSSPRAEDSTRCLSPSRDHHYIFLKYICFCGEWGG